MVIAVNMVLGPRPAAGIRVGRDDFGGGYASLASLSPLQAGRVEIDRSVVTGSTGAGDTGGLGRARARRPARPRHAPVARPHPVQGYHLGRPMTAEAVAIPLSR